MTTIYAAPVDIGGVYNSPWGYSRTIGELLGNTVTFAVIIAGIFFMGVFIWGGYQHIINAGHGRPEEIVRGRQTLQWAFIGLIVVFISYWVLQIINAIIGVPIFQIIQG